MGEDMSATKLTERSIERARKVIELIDGAKTEGEATAAALALQRILATTGLTVEEVRAHGDEPEVESCHSGERASARAWEVALALAVARNMRCEVAYSRRAAYGRMRASMKFYGMGTDPRIAAETFESLRSAATRCLARYAAELRATGRLSGRMSSAMRNGYLLGFVEGLKEAYRAQIESSGELAIVLAVPAEVTEAVNRTTSGVGRSRRVTVTGDESVSARGRADGFGVGRGDRIAS